MPQMPSRNQDVTGYRDVPPMSCHSLILTHHYSKRLPSAIKLCYADCHYGPPIKPLACVIFSVATGRWPEMLWELTRLVRLPDYNRPLTKLVSKAMGYIRQHALIDLVVS